MDAALHGDGSKGKGVRRAGGLTSKPARTGSSVIETSDSDSDVAATEPERVAVVEAALWRGLLGLRVLDLLSLRVEVLGAVGLLDRAVLALVLDVLIVDGHGLVNLEAEGVVVASAEIMSVKCN